MTKITDRDFNNADLCPNIRLRYADFTPALQCNALNSGLT